MNARVDSMQKSVVKEKTEYLPEAITSCNITKRNANFRFREIVIFENLDRDYFLFWCEHNFLLQNSISF